MAAHKEGNEEEHKERGESKETEKSPRNEAHAHREERLDVLRERLYSRGNMVPARERRKLSNQKQQVEETWKRQSGELRKGATEPQRPVPPSPLKDAAVPTASRSVSIPGASRQDASSSREPEARTVSHPGTNLITEVSHMKKKTSRRKYVRTRLVWGGVIFFVIALILSSTILFFGQNTISGDNITIDVDGPFVLGGGEELNMQIAISNQNAVPVESATLIIEYPAGTQSATEPGKELFRERRALEAIRSGEVLNIPMKSVIFGEENEEKMVRVSVEYRVRGSNATFFKEAEPLRFKISSSPVALSVDALSQVTSGQEIELTLTVASNSPSPLSDLLVEAEYPSGFDFTESSLEPISGQNVWRIDVLEPEGEQKITVKGILVGDEEGERVFDFRVGVANERDAFDLASVFSVARAEILIEESFIALDVQVENSRSETVAVSRGEDVNVTIGFTNTLSNTIYDAEIVVSLSGNVLDSDRVNATDGFYDSNTNTISWNARDSFGLSEITPGKSLTESFRFRASSENVRTPHIAFTVSVRGKRVSEDRVPEMLTDSVAREVKFESEIELDSYGLYSEGPFVNTGPIQPVVGEITQYTVVLEVENGSNDITDARMTATLPSYVTWLDLVTAGDTMTYNPSTRQITWDVGDIDARDDEDVSFQVSVLPSQSQVNTIPTILNTQQFRATDRFTGTVLRSDGAAVTTLLERDPDDDGHTGNVLAN